MKAPPDPHHRHRFLAEIISHVVWPPLVLRGQLESFGGRPLISFGSDGDGWGCSRHKPLPWHHVLSLDLNLTPDFNSRASRPAKGKFRDST
jgi:hypothetical protein